MSTIINIKNITLVPNKYKKEGDKQPDFKGQFDFNENRHDIAAWKREGQQAGKYLFVKAQLAYGMREAGKGKSLAIFFNVWDNKNKKEDKHPDYSAGVTLHDVKYDVAVWEKPGELSLKIVPATEQSSKDPQVMESPYKKADKKVQAKKNDGSFGKGYHLVTED